MILVRLEATNTREEDMVIEVIKREPVEEALEIRAATLTTRMILPGEAQEAQEAQEAREAQVGPGDMGTKEQAQLPAEALGTIMTRSLME